MGLDMYIYARKNCFVSSWIDESKGQIKCELPKELDAFKDLDEVKNSLSISFNIDYKIGYWRKANHIHNWFIQNCAYKDECGNPIDDCRPIEITVDKLEKLLDDCKKVLSDHSLASSILPTQSGFFFGSTRYDEDYFGEIERTIEIIEPVLKFAKHKLEIEDYVWEVYYQASW